VDVVEIGEKRAETGEVLKVKPLAVLAMIDEGELDWKIIAINVNDPKASLVNNASDVEVHFPVIILMLCSPMCIYVSMHACTDICMHMYICLFSLWLNNT
jgi:hypothetical protein